MKSQRFIGRHSVRGLGTAARDFVWKNLVAGAEFWVLGAANLPPSGIVSLMLSTTCWLVHSSKSLSGVSENWKSPKSHASSSFFFGTTSNFKQFVGIPECYAVPSLKRWRHWVRIIFGMFWAQCQPWEDRGHMQCIAMLAKRTGVRSTKPTKGLF